MKDGRRTRGFCTQLVGDCVGAKQYVAFMGDV